jgi:hypothetical protein
VRDSALTSSSDHPKHIRTRLQELGFAREQRIKLYGEEFRLVSDPVPDGEGFAVEGVTGATSNIRRMRIPLSPITTVRKELARHEQPTDIG